MRIGTWNLAGRWTPEHEAFLMRQDCDLWLLTEVDERTSLPGFSGHGTAARMAPGRLWASVFSRSGLEPQPDPHPASAMARVEGMAICSSVLPWRACGAGEPWLAGSHAEKTERALKTLRDALPLPDLVWGGDWNHALQGPEYAGSKAGRSHLIETLTALGLKVPTADLPHLIDGLTSIDHVAVPTGTPVSSREHLPAVVGSRRLSDHDAYVVTTF